MRLAASLTVIMLALLTAGTAYAQSALPGDLFYEWKLASELVWRAVSPNPVAADIAIVNRRIEEMNAVAEDPVRYARALEGYFEAVDRLRSELDAETLERILSPVMESIEDAVQPASTPSPDATATPPPEIVGTPLPPLPEIIPTIPPLPLLP
jgi:hypothetical protein